MIDFPIIAWMLAAFLGAASPRAGAGRVVLSAEPPPVAGEAEGADVEPTLVVVARAPADAPPARFAARKAIDADAEDRAIATALAGARAVEMRGGSWVDWYHAGHAGRHEREWTRALRRAHDGGASIRASGGAAAWITSWSPVQRAALNKPAQDPHDASLDIPAPGLGLLGPEMELALVGVLTADAPTADRVIERAIAFGYRDVLLLAGPTEVEWDSTARRLRVAGRPEAADVAWIDLGAGTRSRDVVRAARVTTPRDGDVIELGPARLLGTAFDGDVAEDAGARALLARIARDAGAKPSAVLRASRVARDEDTLRSARGGLSRAKVDLEIVRP